MGRALEVISVSATAPGGTLTTFSAVAGNSLTIRDSNGAKMLGIINKRQGAGAIRVRSPLMHDASVGIESRCVTGATVIHAFDAPQPLESQDTLSVTGTGSATAGDIELSAFVIGYDDLSGVEGRFIDSAAVRRRAVNIFAKTVSVTATGAGGYSGGTTISATDDFFKANTDYAVLGALHTATANVAFTRINAPDWGNLGIPLVNASSDFGIAARSLCWLSDVTNEPCVPVFNAANRGLVTLSALADENGVAYSVAVVLAELRRTRS